MTYCETCLRASIGSLCRYGDCSPSRPSEVDGLRALHSKGYRLNLGAIWLVQNDDPDNFLEARIADWEGSSVEAFRELIRHNFPKTSIIECYSCREAEVGDLGELCPNCSLERADWVRAGEYL